MKVILSDSHQNDKNKSCFEGTNCGSDSDQDEMMTRTFSIFNYNIGIDEKIELIISAEEN